MLAVIALRLCRLQRNQPLTRLDLPWLVLTTSSTLRFLANEILTPWIASTLQTLAFFLPERR